MKDLLQNKSGDCSVESRRICPFISSSFVDLEEEFKHLHTETFVKLNKLYNTYGCQFSCVDHRRTAVDSRQTSDYILKNALDNVLACNPFFMCIIGGQYGPHRSSNCGPLSDSSIDLDTTKSMSLIDRNFLTAANHGHDWVLNTASQLCSMLELEIQLAAFKPRDYPNHCYFYIKDYYQKYLNQEDNITKTNSNSILEDDFQTVFEIESEYAKRRFHDMIRRIVNKGFPIKFFTSKEELGNAITKDWSQLLYKLYQKPPTHFIQSDEFFTQKWAIQSFVNAHQKKYLKYSDLEKIENKLYSHVNYIVYSSNKHQHENDDFKNNANEAEAFKTGDGLFSTSQSFVQSISYNYDERKENEKKIFTLVGDPGIGKTTVLTNWIQDFQQNFPNVVVIQEFVGSSLSSYDLASFMRKCIRTIRERYWRKRCSSSESLPEAETWAGLIQSFHSALQLLPCIVLIDSINDLKFAMDKDIGTLKSLSWLPQKVPKHCRMIFSSRQSDLTYQMLNNRKDVVVQCMPRLRQSIREKLFQLHYRNDVVQFLGREHLEKIWINRLSEKPLFISALSDLLRSCRDTNDINQVILKCTAFRIFRDFWKSVFILWSRRYSWNKQSSGQPGSIRVRSTAVGWVADALKMIATSRGGLYASEIVHLLMLIGYRGRATVTLHDFDIFLRAAGSALRVRQDGLINISHEDIKIALGHCLLGTGIHSAGTPSASSRSESKQKQLHLLLASFFLKYGSMERKLTQLPWHLYEGKDYNFLCQVLSKPRFFLAMCKEARQNPLLYVDMFIYWRELIKRDFNLSHCIELMLEQAKNEQTSLLHPDNSKDDASRRPSGAPPPESSKWKQLALKGPSMIIVTQHDDAQLSRTEESRSETEDKDFSETESCSFFLTESENDSHQLVAGWLPSEDSPENQIEATLLDNNELATLYHDVAWLMFHLGKPFYKDAKSQLQKSRDYLNSLKPLSSEQFLAMFDLTCTENSFVKNGDRKHVIEALEIFQSLPINTLELSFIEKKNIMEANGMLKLIIARSLIEKGEDEKAHALILDTFNTMKSCESIPGQAHTTCVFGKLLASQDLTTQAEAMLKKALSSFTKWFGPKHISVANVLCEQGRFHSKSSLMNGSSNRVAMLAYKKALEIFKFNDRTLEYGEVINIIGELLSKEGSLRSKEEAKECFLRAHDIFVTTLDEDNEKLLQIANNYKEISNDLRKGKYAHGSSKPPDIRTSERPYSSLSYHEWELKQITSNESQFSLASNQLTRRRSLQESISPATERPYSSFSTRSVGKYVLVTPKDNNVRRIKSANARMYQSLGSTSIRNLTLSPVSYREKNWDKQALEDKLTDDVAREPLNITPLSPYLQERPTTSEGKEVPVVIVPAGRNSRLSVKLDLEDFHRASKHQFDDNLDSVYRTEVVSGSERTALRSAHRRRNSRHEQKCVYQSGPDKLSLTIHGPHSSVTDILPPPPSPRVNVRSSGITHRSAWFHVPGRYQKPGEILPTKRSQRPGSASTLRTTERIDENASMKSGRKPNVAVTRRHSSPVVQHSNMHVAFNGSIEVECLPSTNYNYPNAQNTPAPSLVSN